MKTCKSIFLAGITILCLSKVALGTLDPSIVLYFTFDEDEGDKVTDISGTGNNGSIHNAKRVDGKYGHALEFDGENAYVEVLSDVTLDISTMTLMAWIYKSEFSVQSNGETIISRKDSGCYCLEVTGWENRFPEKLSSEPQISGTYRPVASPDPVPLNRWVHTAVTYDGDLLRLYLDGEVVTEEQWPGAITNNTANYLYVGIESAGTAPDATHGAFKGMIDEAIVANRAFSADEIKTYMEGSSAVEPKGKLPVWWSSIKSDFGF